MHFLRSHQPIARDTWTTFCILKNGDTLPVLGSGSYSNASGCCNCETLWSGRQPALGDQLPEPVTHSKVMRDPPLAPSQIMSGPQGTLSLTTFYTLAMSLVSVVMGPLFITRPEKSMLDQPVP